MRRFVFVFGSNLRGVHGAGAALFARQRYGARYGQGVGPQGQAYAIPTKAADVHTTLPLVVVRGHVLDFLRYAQTRPTEDFLVTRIGCGLAGYSDGQISPFFSTAPSNCILPVQWRGVASRVTRYHNEGRLLGD